MDNKFFIITIIISIIIFLNFINVRYLYYDTINYVANIINPYIASNSLIDNKPFYNGLFLYETRILTKNWKIFRDEALLNYKSYSDVKGDYFFEDDLIKTNNKWKKIYIKLHSDIHPLARKLCPKSSNIIHSLPNIKLAMFSLLEPGTKIHPHKGPYKGLLRYHLGLITPNSDDCFISVNNIKYSWKDGDGIIFDDTFEHWVNNNTDKRRIILLCDIIRPVNYSAHIINIIILNIFSMFT
tara:strand:+ start:216 stop:935 length:720 start_codon:yes stop_codon:yes gene_type:complete